jgi:nitrous oxide reductase accessory protein NosL
MHLSDGDRCPVCAMPVTEHKKFAGAIALRDGQTYYFCGTGCLIRSWLHPEVFLGAGRGSLDKAVVKEYFAGEQVDARGVIFVAGSDVIGPMGPALVPVKNEADMTTFKNRHGGKTSFRLDEMNDERWKTITGKNILGGKAR